MKSTFEQLSRYMLIVNRLMGNNVYVPADETVAENLVDFAVNNPNDQLGYLEFIYANEWCFTHFKKGDKIVVYRLTPGGYRVRRQSTFEIGYLVEAYISKK